ncbi:matrixin family metalloprotease [Paenibacillus agilis]|nr:matrixin family metalloprotease [Paenibacillus agilis]
METIRCKGKVRNKLAKMMLIPTAMMVISLSVTTPASAASVSLLGWDLVDSGKRMDWDGSSAYISQFNSGVSLWNSYKSGVIRKDTITTIQDLAISDYYEVSSTAGVTSSAGTIRFNNYQMAGYTSTKKLNVAIHEIGHALGLGHNTSADVMYAYVSNNTALSVNDRASYDAAYLTY